MAKIKYDVTDVEESPDFDKPIPEGAYVCEITEAEQKVSKNSGNDMIALVLSVTNGDFKGRNLWDYITLTDSASWKMKQFTKALGRRAKGTLDTDELVGAKLLVRVKHESDTRAEAIAGNNGTAPLRAKVGSLQPLPEDHIESDNGDEPDDDDGVEQYGEWSVPDLKTELKARSLSLSGTKKSLVKRLEEDDDGDDDAPF